MLFDLLNNNGTANSLKVPSQEMLMQGLKLRNDADLNKQYGEFVFLYTLPLYLHPAL